jgi:exodeoxyribonuclease-5
MIEHNWSPQQARALSDVAAWIKDPAAPQVFRLFGYAGTGKTTLAQHLALDVRYPIFAAFTGKAASVLRERGCPMAQTLHSLLYKVGERDRARLRELQDELSKLTPEHPDYREVKSEHDLELDKVRRPWFYVNEDSALHAADLLVVDEVSMVDQKLGTDILSFKKKVLVLGDPAQLPPVKGGGFFTNVKPDILLTEIHRQALDNPILRLATMARQGEPIPYCDLKQAVKMRRETVTDAWLAENGQILCGKNETRRSLNQRVRTHLGRTGELPKAKDRLVFLQNDNRRGFLNGTLCTAQCDATTFEQENDEFWINVSYEKHMEFDLRVDARPFRGQEPGPGRSSLQMDFGYALTVHKAQGSQWPSVILYDDGFGKREADMRKRWLYTAITRAEKQLFILTS